MEAILEAFGIDWHLIVIQIFNFAILAGLLWYFLYTPILKVLSDRQLKIEKGVHDAKAAAVAKESAENEKKDILSQAQIEAEAVQSRAKLHADEKAADLLKDASLRAEKILKDTELQCEDIKKEAHKESESEIAKVAVLCAEKILREKA